MLYIFLSLSLLILFICIVVDKVTLWLQFSLTSMVSGCTRTERFWLMSQQMEPRVLDGISRSTVHPISCLPSLMGVFKRLMVWQSINFALWLMWRSPECVLTIYCYQWKFCINFYNRVNPKYGHKSYSLFNRPNVELMDRIPVSHLCGCLNVLSIVGNVGWTIDSKIKVLHQCDRSMRF